MTAPMTVVAQARVSLSQARFACNPPRQLIPILTVRYTVAPLQEEKLMQPRLLVVRRR